MTTINYPSQLRPPLRENYSVQHVSPLLRTQMQSGRARQRRLFTSVPSMVQVSFHFGSEAEARLFEVFFQDTLKDGAEWFNAPLRTPMGFQNYECRFTDIYGPLELSGRSWRTSAQLEIRERQTIGAGWAAVPDYVVHSDILDLAINREWPSA